MKPRLRVGVDLDGVLADYSGWFVQQLRTQFNVPKDGEPQLSWEFNQWEGVTPAMVDAVYETSRHITNFWEKLGLLKGVNAIEQLYYMSRYELVFITKRYETAGNYPQIQTCQWLADKLNIIYPVVLVVDGDKGAIAAALNLYAFIDDKVSNCESVAKALPACKVYLQDQTYNRENSYFPRVDSFNEFVERINATK